MDEVAHAVGGHRTDDIVIKGAGRGGNVVVDSLGHLVFDGVVEEFGLLDGIGNFRPLFGGENVQFDIFERLDLGVGSLEVALPIESVLIETRLGVAQAVPIEFNDFQSQFSVNVNLDGGGVGLTGDIGHGGDDLG